MLPVKAQKELREMLLETGGGQDPCYILEEILVKLHTTIGMKV
jgi:hypothetical protein